MHHQIALQVPQNGTDVTLSLVELHFSCVAALFWHAKVSYFIQSSVEITRGGECPSDSGHSALVSAIGSYSFWERVRGISALGDASDKRVFSNQVRMTRR
jgi:hypothetical protein